LVEVEVQRWNAPKEAHFVSHSRVVRELPGAVLGRPQVRISLSRDALHPPLQYVLPTGKGSFVALA
jgi:hypothetical protein